MAERKKHDNLTNFFFCSQWNNATPPSLPYDSYGKPYLAFSMGQINVFTINKICSSMVNSYAFRWHFSKISLFVRELMMTTFLVLSKL